ncbi:MAG: threonine--tRNA ligase [Cellvibrionales bacterium TMED49]|nr:threonine--tRNA ligase [Porticoccaceae bacterium]OUU37351.1 MAG: threonine--tRNA ligase [Cellvibrionales bacterium TMED49]
MPIVTLPDSSTRNYTDGVTVLEIAHDIGPGLGKATIAGLVDGVQVDSEFRILKDSTLEIITERSEAGLAIIRHSTAHLMAMAVKQLFPGAQVTIGPVIDNGFYYDFAYKRAFLPGDLNAIEERMKELVEQDYKISREEWCRNEAEVFFLEIGEEYKAQIIKSIPENEPISLYTQGSFVDLCRGPHVPSTGRLTVFKLLKVAGAYWRGDHENEMLQRIYGTAWLTKKELKKHLNNLEEAEKRDHRKIGKKLELFHIQDEAPGSVFWHPRGWTIYQVIEQYMRSKQLEEGYQEIKTPQLVDLSLWKKSGHADKFGEEMYVLETDDKNFVVKPMNCPCHVQIFNQGLKSYRDLPLRLAEFGSCHRNEPSGSLHGIMRVRSFTQDDAHIFCTEGQIQFEVAKFIDFLHDVYTDFGFNNILYRLSTRPNKRVGSDETWDRAEKALADALNAKDLQWQTLAGEGAFYGPKIEFSLTDAIGRIWQLGTIQVDFSMPQRLDAQYVAEDGSRQAPVMLHRAILGSFERFIGILTEHYEGVFPLWLAPEQVVVMNITDSQRSYASEITKSLRNRGYRVISDLRNEKIGYKIRHHSMRRVPYLVVVGDKEKDSMMVSVRSQAGLDHGIMTLQGISEMLSAEVNSRGINIG